MTPNPQPAIAASPEPIFTAARIAACLGVSANAVHQRTAKAPITGYVEVRGQQAKAWCWHDLPPDLCVELASAATARGWRDPSDMLKEGIGPWAPALAWEEIGEAYRREATRRRDVLASVMGRGGIAPKEKRELAHANYACVFGHRISDPTIQAIMDLAEKRDKLFGRWDRPELYLSEAAFQTSNREPSGKLSKLHGPLHELWPQLDNREKPTADDRAFLFDAVFRHYERIVPETMDRPQRRRVKTSLIHFLWDNLRTGLSKSEGALRRNFDVLLMRWRSGGRTVDALSDTRPIRSGNFRRPEFAEDIKQIVNETINHDGSESLGYRKLRQAGKLSPEFEAYYPFDPRRAKSAVPRSIRAAVTPQAEAAQVYRHGPKAARLAGPYIARDWSGLRPGSWFVFDDVTFNAPFKDVDQDGREFLTRGECLMGADEVSNFIPEGLLIGGRDGGKASYNSAHIVNLMDEVEQKVGLPREDGGITLENGIWAARLVPGQVRRRSSLKWRDIQTEFADYNIKLERHHATTPRAKIIEGTFRILQERMRNLPGFVGFNERTDKREAVDKLIDRAKRGDMQALAFFPTMEEMRNILRRAIDEFNNDPQNGKRNPGKSPKEAWDEALLKWPLRRLDDPSRSLFRTHGDVFSIDADQGVKITMPGLGKVCYANDDLRKLHLGGLKKVYVRFNPNHPQFVTVVPPNRQHRFSVEGFVAPAKHASKEQFETINRHKKEWTGPSRVIFLGTKNDVVSTITRDNETSEEAKDLGRFIMDTTKANTDAQAARNRKLSQANRLAGQAGFTAPTEIKNPDRVIEGIEMEREAREELAREQRQEGNL